MTVASKKEVVIVVFFKMSPQSDNRVKVFALLRAGHKLSEIANLVGFAQPSMQTLGRWRRCQQTSRQWSTDRCPSIRIPQAVTIHNSLSTTACTPIGTLAIVHAHPVN